MKYLLHVKRIMYSENIVYDHPKNNSLCIEIRALVMNEHVHVHPTDNEIESKTVENTKSSETEEQRTILSTQSNCFNLFNLKKKKNSISRFVYSFPLRFDT